MDWPFVAASVGSAGLVGWILIAHARGATPRRQFSWQMPPRLRVADGVDHVSATSCIRAWQILGSLGAKVNDEVERGGPATEQDGYVVVVPIDAWAHPNHAGRSVTNVQLGALKATRATVELPPNATDLVALHEFLHCMGFVQHVSMSGHVLSRTTAKAGPDRRGIAAALRSTG